MLVLAALIALAGQVLAAEQRPVRLCFNHYPPYVFGDEIAGAEPSGGLKVELARQVFAELGVPLRLTVLPFQRCLKLIESGVMDGALPLAQTQERERYMTFSGPANPQSYVFVYRRARFPDGLRWDNIDELTRWRLLLNLGSAVDAEMEARFSRVAPILRSPDLKTLLLMLNADRADLGAMDRQVALHMISTLGLGGQLAISQQPINDRPVRFGFAQGSPAAALVPRIDAILIRMHRDGSMAKLLARWSGD